MKPYKTILLVLFLLWLFTWTNEIVIPASADTLTLSESEQLFNPQHYEEELAIIDGVYLPERGIIQLPAENAPNPQNLKPQPLNSILMRIMMCESGGNYLAKSKTSTAKGLFQIIDGTWKAYECEGDPLNGEDNTACAIKMFNKSGTWNWLASSGCWSRR
jgi:hypothetical protein